MLGIESDVFGRVSGCDGGGGINYYFLFLEVPFSRLYLLQNKYEEKIFKPIRCVPSFILFPDTPL